MTAHHKPPDDLDQLHEHVRAKLAKAAYRYTGNRRRLIEALARSGRPLTLPDIITAEPALAQSSVYRNLELLEKIGVTCRIAVGNEHTHFELAEQLVGHHHHLICVLCGTIQDVSLDHSTECLLEHSLAQAASLTDFTPLHHTLDLHGRCAGCSPIENEDCS